jgi:hypothetical protein
MELLPLPPGQSAPFTCTGDGQGYPSVEHQLEVYGLLQAPQAPPAALDAPGGPRVAMEVLDARTVKAQDGSFQLVCELRNPSGLGLGPATVGVSFYDAKGNTTMGVQALTEIEFAAPGETQPCKIPNVPATSLYRIVAWAQAPPSTAGSPAPPGSIVVGNLSREQGSGTGWALKATMTNTGNATLLRARVVALWRDADGHILAMGAYRSHTGPLAPGDVERFSIAYPLATDPPTLLAPEIHASAWLWIR